jgi:RNA polymerase sigma-70 factor, ECF subfamily
MPSELALELNFDLLMIRLQEAETPPAEAESVRAWVIRAKAGDTAAFEQLLQRYQRPVLGTAIKLLGNVEDGYDAAQEVFLRFHKYLHRFDEQQALLPWLYRLTVNVCRDIQRKRSNVTTVSWENAKVQHHLHQLTSDQDLEAEVSLQQERTIISQAIDTLPEKERAALVLRDVECLETKEVAQILGASETTIRSQISMARVKIKKYRDQFLSRFVQRSQ